MISFGFTIQKFFQVMQEQSALVVLQNGFNARNISG